MEEASRFKDTPNIIFNGEVTKSSWRKLTILKTDPQPTDYFPYVVTTVTEGRPDLISNEVYNTPMLDWVIIAYNKANEVFNWPQTSQVIKIPREELFMPELLL
jgi:hypothetical protein